MVSVSHAVAHSGPRPPIEVLAEGLNEREREQIESALAFVTPLYQEHTLGTGEQAQVHALGMALIAASLRLDVEARLAALLFATETFSASAVEKISGCFGRPVATLVEGLGRFKGLRLLTRTVSKAGGVAEIRSQNEILRKMMLAMVQDIRVVLLRLISRTQTLRYLTDLSVVDETCLEVARESLNIYSPLANRLGVWQIKWEMEDLSFRFLEPATYKRIARMLDERRLEREEFIFRVIARLQDELKAASIKGEVFGRPKHIYSIYNKMHSKKLDFSQVYDIRAVRVLVDEIQDCYKVLDIVNHIWQPIPEEYDDYISRPKNNNYRSLHTALLAEDGRALEVQIRTYEMHRHAELGVAAHWRYKEGGNQRGDYDGKIALLRNLLSWRDEIVDSSAWVEGFRRASLDDTIYLLTPQGRVLDLMKGATPVDFAYALHTEVGHRCRGAKVDGHLVPLNTPLKNGQTVEIVTAKEGGPSRDWLNPQQGYIVTGRARSKIRRYFTQLEEDELLTRGRSVVTREMQREGQTQANIEELAGKLGFKNADAMFVAAARGEVGPRAMQVALRDEPPATPEKPPEREVPVGRSRSGDSSDKVLINGIGKLMTTLSRCCKPAPPDAIQGFVTRGRGISIHRVDCPDFQRLRRQNPERVVEAQWGERASSNDLSVFPVDVDVEASDRQGLLRDISEILSREKLNVTGVNTLTKKGTAFMRFTLEVASVSQLQRALKAIRSVRDVTDAKRR